MDLTRREVVAALSTVGSAWLAAAAGCRRPPDPPAGAFAYLTPTDGADLEAIAARIFPTDDRPGATEAGVVHFIDRALGEFLPDQRPLFTEGLADLRAAVSRRHGPNARFDSLGSAEQDELLRAIEKTEFFGAVRSATLAGMFALPKYGGNRDFVGWNLIGQERSLEFKPPFGWYDRPENQQALLGRVL